MEETLHWTDRRGRGNTVAEIDTEFSEGLLSWASICYRCGVSDTFSSRKFFGGVLWMKTRTGKDKLGGHVCSWEM